MTHTRKLNNGLLTYNNGASIYTDKIVFENEEFYHVVGLGAGEELWKAGYAVGNRVYKREQIIN